MPKKKLDPVVQAYPKLPLIAACLIVKNSGAVIEKCLQSIRPHEGAGAAGGDARRLHDPPGTRGKRARPPRVVGSLAQRNGCRAVCVLRRVTLPTRFLPCSPRL